jgi:RNA polymerase primary sigma factor
VEVSAVKHSRELNLPELGYSLLTREGEVELARRIERGGLVGEAARRELVESNQRLVIAIARRYRERGLPLSDLVQEGNLGLLKAVDKYDYRLGYRFSTYAIWWIRQGITRALYDKARTIRLPVHIVEKRTRVEQVQRALRHETGTDGGMTEIAARLELPVHRLERLMDVVHDPISLDEPLKGMVDRPIGETVADSSIPSPHEVVASRELSLRTLRALSRLDDRERRMLRLRFGIGARRPHTLEEIGTKFGVTRERVRQIESKALQKLRASGDAEILESLLEQ